MEDLVATEVKIKKRRKSEPAEENNDAELVEPKLKKSKKEPKSESGEVTAPAELKKPIAATEVIKNEFKKLKQEAKIKPETDPNEVTQISDDSNIPWEILITRCQPIAFPLATKKLCKKIFKLIGKANKRKQLRKGVREVQKFIRKGEKGIVILAGDTSPIDVISHLPVVCEEKSIPYCYVPSKEELGATCSTNRQTCCMLVKLDDDYAKLYNEVYAAIKLMPLPI